MTRGAFGAGGARLGIRCPLPGLSVCAAHRRCGSAARAGDVETAIRTYRRPRRQWRSRLAVSAVYIVGNESFANWQALWFAAGFARPGSYSGAGAGRARLRISSAAAKPARSALCSTSPNAVAGRRDQYQDNRWPHQIERGRTERDPAEHRVVVQHNGEPERRAQPGAEAALAGQRDLRIFDREITQIERLAERRADRRAAASWSGGRWAGRAGIAWLAHYAARFLSGQPVAAGRAEAAPPGAQGRQFRDAAARGGIGRIFPRLARAFRLFRCGALGYEGAGRPMRPGEQPW